MSNLTIATRELPGPPPDPSRLPSIVRVVGDLDVDAGVSELGVPERTEPNLAEISLFLEELEEDPEPYLIICQEIQWLNLGFNL